MIDRRTETKRKYIACQTKNQESRTEKAKAPSEAGYQGFLNTSPPDIPLARVPPGLRTAGAFLPFKNRC